MAFDVSWFAVHSFGLDKAPVLLSSLDRKGIVTTAQRDWKSQLSLERVSVLEFLLQVHGAEDQDFGNYYCSATPWVKSATGSWQKEAEIYSKPVFITVKMDGENDTQAIFLGFVLSLCCAAVDGIQVAPRLRNTPYSQHSPCRASGYKQNLLLPQLSYHLPGALLGQDL